MNEEPEHQDEPEAEATRSRRDILRQAGIVSVAAVWATPIVQTIGAVPAFATGTPSPPPPSPPPPPPPPFYGISYVGLIFSCNGIDYKAKWEEDVAGFTDPGATPFCTTPSGWDTRTKYPNTGAIGVSTSYIDGELYQVSFTLPSTCTWADGAGVVKGATECVEGGVSGGTPLTITFTAPAK